MISYIATDQKGDILSSVSDTMRHHAGQLLFVLAKEKIILDILTYCDMIYAGESVFL